MYGKTLEDFPERFEAFDQVLRELSVEAINMGFDWCLRNMDEFPVPAEVKRAAIDQMQWKQFREQEALRESERVRLEAIKAERFQEPLVLPERVEMTPEQRDAERERLAAEFQDMLRQSKEKNRFGGRQ